MISKRITKLLVMFAFFIFISAFDLSVNRVSAQTCDESADADIVASIYAKIKGNSKLASQEKHINVTSKARVIRLQGWTESESDFNTLHGYAMDALNALKPTCGMVNPNGFYKTKPTEDQMRSMCAGGTRPCGDICIPENDSCNIPGGSTKMDD